MSAAVVDPEFMTPEEFARYEETARDALARVISLELNIPLDEAYRRVRAASADLSGYLRGSQPQFWMSITKTRVHRDYP